MPEAIDAQLTIVCGARGKGKTNLTLTQLYKAVGEKKRKALIFDVKGEFADYLYRKDEPRHTIKAINLNMVPRFSVNNYPELVRLAPFTEDGRPLNTEEMLENLKFVFKNFRNGILLTEDLSAVITDAIPGDIYGSLATLRQAGVDVIAHFQMIGKAAHPKMIAMANNIRLHKTEDSVKRHREKFLEKFEIMSIAENIVNRRHEWGIKNKVFNEKGKFFNVTIDMEQRLIKGIFTQPEAEQAIEDYLSEEGKISKVAKRLDKEGKKVFANYQDAYRYEEQKLFDEFFNFGTYGKLE